MWASLQSCCDPFWIWPQIKWHRFISKNSWSLPAFFTYKPNLSSRFWAVVLSTNCWNCFKAFLNTTVSGMLGGSSSSSWIFLLDIELFIERSEAGQTVLSPGCKFLCLVSSSCACCCYCLRKCQLHGLKCCLGEWKMITILSMLHLLQANVPSSTWCHNSSLSLIGHWANLAHKPHDLKTAFHSPSEKVRQNLLF